MKIEFKEIVKKIFRDCFWLLIVLIAIFQLWHSWKNQKKSSDILRKPGAY
jgi:hypothetical protein